MSTKNSFTQPLSHFLNFSLQPFLAIPLRASPMCGKKFRNPKSKFENQKWFRYASVRFGTGHGTGTTSRSLNVYTVWYNGTGCTGGEDMVAPGAANNSPVFSSLRSSSGKFAQIFTFPRVFPRWWSSTPTELDLSR